MSESEVLSPVDLETPIDVSHLELARAHNHFLANALSNEEQKTHAMQKRLATLEQEHAELQQQWKKIKEACGGDPQRLLKKHKQIQSALTEARLANKELAVKRRRSKQNFAKLLEAAHMVCADFEEILRFISASEMIDETEMPKVNLQLLAALSVMKSKDFE